MLKRFVAPVAAVIATAGAVLVTAGVASAHHPTITANAVCVDGAPVITFTSTAWEGWGGDPTNDPSRANAQVDILLDGAPATSGAYVAPTYSFSGSIPVAGSPGDVVEVTAVAVASWGNGAAGGQERDRHRDAARGRLRGRPVDRPLHRGRVPGPCRRRPRHSRADHPLRPAAVQQPRGQLGREPVPHDRAPDDGRLHGRPAHRPGSAAGTARHARRDRDRAVQRRRRLHDRVHARRPRRAGQLRPGRAAHLQHGNPSDVVLDMPLRTISGGNLQAHYDQPHS